MQNAYISKLMEIAEKDERVIHLLADSGTGYDEIFRMNMPDQILNVGIAEENLIGVSSGLATCGFIPFAFTAGAFLAYRAMEFIRDDVCFQNLNVKIVGMGSGLSWSSLGPTHHTTEDISVLRVLPNLMILSPATPRQVSECVRVAYEHDGPVYIKIGMNREKEFYDNNYRMDSGSDIIREGKDMLIISTGSILEEVMISADLLADNGYSVKVINVCRIKPFDFSEILKCLKNFNQIYVVEEHNIYGGLASILCENIATNGLGIKVIPIGLNDKFASGYGTHKKVREINELDGYNIYNRIKSTLN